MDDEATLSELHIATVNTDVVVVSDFEAICFDFYRLLVVAGFCGYMAYDQQKGETEKLSYFQGNRSLWCF